jgi:uncharacterized membrane protein
MRITFEKYPTDIIICIVWSIITLPIALLNMETTLRTIFGLPLLLFIPGYILIFALFPTKKTDKGIDIIERIALSFGLSIAIVPLIGLILNYSPWGIRLQPILILLFIFIIGVGSIAIYRWKKTIPDERFTVSIELSLPKYENKRDKILTTILVLSIIIAGASLVYAIIAPKTGEKFTEFYLLNTERRADDYPKNLTIGEEASVIIGVINHEYQTINYTIEIWLINQTTVYNESTEENETIYNHAWYMNKISIMLNHTPADIEGSWKPQWENNYTFNISQKGEDFKLAFLLFTTPTDTSNYNVDYKDIIEEKISNAYRETHLFITVA